MNNLWRQKVLIAAVTALASAAALGCGGGDSSSGSSEMAVPLTKAEFLKQGDQICEKRLEEKDEAVKTALEQLSTSERASPSEESLEELGESALQPMQKLTDELNELPAPASDKAAARTITSELEAGLKKAEADPEILAESNPFEKAARAARSYGFKTCNF